MEDMKRTSRQTEPKAYTSLAVVTLGTFGSDSSSTRARIISGAIHRIVPAKNEEHAIPVEFEKSDMTLLKPKSVMMA